MEITIEIPKYIRKVKLSEARKRKYYEKGKKGPVAKKYADTSKYGWKRYGSKQFLIDLETDERVVANPRAAGTPRYMAVNGQKIYNAEASPHVRSKVMSDIKKSFAPFINKLDPIDLDSFPINISLEIHDVITDEGNNQLWDVDNRSMPYIKAFQDCLTGNKDKDGKNRNKQIIPDDHVLFITQPPLPKFIPVENEDDRKLVFTIVSEEDKRIIENKEFQRRLKDAKYEFTRISSSSK
jgi:hypothetical protein